ncbi:hypothetical protein TUBRATIS_24620 [Tubulinosema ratisbonensis]|uniref:Uncharacterized protein n=1 Tax=Tubulinosema ratisbonensis TaxID=291195 RepID=A0A437AJ26_9MICR|nr:hypothetical protein TUBRATIS_24620 [Tubulinosema ratisbonensis]
MSAKKKKPLLCINHKLTKPKLKKQLLPNEYQNNKRREFRAKFLKIIEKREKERNKHKYFSSVISDNQPEFSFNDPSEQIIIVPRMCDPVYTINPLTSIVYDSNTNKSVKWYVRLWRKVKCC